MREQLINQLVDLARLAPSADNSQPLSLEWDGEKLSVYFDAQRVGGNTFPADAHATLLAAGAMLENILQAARALGLTAKIDFSAPTSDGSFGRIALEETSGSHIDANAIEQVTNRHCNRGPFLATPISDNVCLRLSDEFEASARSWWSQKPDHCRRAADLVRRASTLRFQTREVHEWLGRSLRFSQREVARGDGLDIATLALPPGGALLLRLISDWNRMRTLNRFGAYRLLSRVDAAPLRKGPGLLAIVGPENDDATIAAGRLMERLWIRLNAQGLAVHPYYVVSDQLTRLGADQLPPSMLPLATSLKEDAAALFRLDDGEIVHMLLRVGHPRSVPKRSLRLPLDEIFHSSAG